LSYGRIF